MRRFLTVHGLVATILLVAQVVTGNWTQHGSIPARIHADGAYLVVLIALLYIVLSLGYLYTRKS